MNVYITLGFAPMCLTNLVNDLHRVFLEYSLSQSAYLCLNPFTLKIYVSHHVQFVEIVFSYMSLYNTLPHPTSTTLNTQIPPILTVSIPTSSQQTDYTPSAISSQELPLPETISQPTISSSQQVAPENHPSHNPSHQTTKQQITVPPPTQHSMTTRAKNNIPNQFKSLTFTSSKPLPKLLHLHPYHKLSKTLISAKLYPKSMMHLFIMELRN